ncbi:MAG: AAA family ATPase [Hyphomicrobiaceae bacterium]|nr:AAA family ATPase [Hyphomicrobiaceae bacterium]
MDGRLAHVIVFGNEKGGCGKSTAAMHVIVALARAGYRVAAIDLDSRQLTLHNYIENRRRWAEASGADLPMPTSYPVPRATELDVRSAENKEFNFFADALAQAEAGADFVVIDTPGHDTYLNRLAHSLADTLVSPINDSYVDFDVLGRVDFDTGTMIKESCYAEMVREARRQRALVDGGGTNWIVLRNRLSRLVSRNNRNVGQSMEILGRSLNFRVAEGMTERVVYREFFPLGLTALDPLEEVTLATRPNLSHVAAREEVRSLISALQLPIILPQTSEFRMVPPIVDPILEEIGTELDLIMQSTHPEAVIHDDRMVEAVALQRQ